MAPNTFLIKLDKANSTYVPGESITGCVIIDLEEPKRCREFRIAFKGEAYVHWTEEHSDTDMDGKSRTRTEHYSAREKYLDFQQPLIHKPPDEKEVEIPVSRTEYRFVYQLPNNIPCSFEHNTGYIRYTIKAIVDIPWRFDWCAKATFTVVTPFDLNDVVHQCVPIDDETIKNYSCVCFDKGSIYARVRIPSTGYVSGQTIEVDACFDVKSSKVHVTGVSAKLEEVITFHAQGSRKIDRVALQSSECRGPLGGNAEIRLKLYIPPVPPSNLLPCDIIQLEYRVVVNVHVNGVHKKIHRKYPILIGTIPLRSSLWQHSNNEDILPSAPANPDDNKVTPYPSNLPGMVAPVQETPSQPIGWVIPPPSYEECLQKVTNIKDTDDTHDAFGGEQPFAPRYPVYSLITPNQPKH